MTTTHVVTFAFTQGKRSTDLICKSSRFRTTGLSCSISSDFSSHCRCVAHCYI
nr:MAG TPA: hypothetical protein [Caudoviricetes sp.]